MNIHKESLLQIPLVQQMMQDPSVEFCPRAIDNNWKYREYRKLNISGFSPHTAKIYYAQISALSSWKKQCHLSARDWNEGDFLVREVLFAVHDYLHIWSYQAIQALMPEIGFATKPITRRNFEDFIFCHLLTEAAATVGLDYWYLAQVHLNDVTPIGTRVVTLTTPYHSWQLSEVQQFNSSFNHFEPRFFQKIMQVYLDGTVDGFNMSDLKRSPILMKWFSQELLYGEQQREYTRKWFQFLSSEEIRISKQKLRDKIAISKKWQAKLIEIFSQLLWEKVVEKKLHFMGQKNISDVWSSHSGSSKFNFLFENLNVFDGDFWPVVKKQRFDKETWDYQFWQIVSRYKLQQFATKEINKLKEIEINRDLNALEKILSLKKNLPMTSQEPKNIFIIN